MWMKIIKNGLFMVIVGINKNRNDIPVYTKTYSK